MTDSPRLPPGRSKRRSRGYVPSSTTTQSPTTSDSISTSYIDDGKLEFLKLEKHKFDDDLLEVFSGMKDEKPTNTEGPREESVGKRSSTSSRSSVSSRRSNNNTTTNDVSSNPLFRKGSTASNQNNTPHMNGKNATPNLLEMEGELGLSAVNRGRLTELKMRELETNLSHTSSRLQMTQRNYKALALSLHEKAELLKEKEKEMEKLKALVSEWEERKNQLELLTSSHQNMKEELNQLKAIR